MSCSSYDSRRDELSTCWHGMQSDLVLVVAVVVVVVVGAASPVAAVDPPTMDVLEAPVEAPIAPPAPPERLKTI